MTYFVLSIGRLATHQTGLYVLEYGTRRMGVIFVRISVHFEKEGVHLPMFSSLVTFSHCHYLIVVLLNVGG